MTSTESFYMTLPSSSSLDIYPGNTMSQYKISFTNPIRIDREQYEVGLCEFQLDGFVFNIEEQKAVITICRHNNEIHKITKVMEKEYKTAKMDGESFFVIDINVNGGYYRDEMSFLENLNTNLRKNNLTQDLEFRFKRTFRNNRLKPLIELVSNRELDINSKKLFKIYMSAWFAYGIRKSNTNDSSRNENILTYEIDFDKLINSPSQCFIYTDIIEHQIVGADRMQLLRIVFLPNNNGGLCISYDSPHYLNLINGDIANINIYIKDVRGLPYYFSHGNVTVKFHFRRKY